MANNDKKIDISHFLYWKEVHMVYAHLRVRKAQM